MTNQTSSTHTARSIRAKKPPTHEQLAERLGGAFAKVNCREAGSCEPQQAVRVVLSMLAREPGFDDGDKGEVPEEPAAAATMRVPTKSGSKGRKE